MTQTTKLRIKPPVRVTTHLLDIQQIAEAIGVSMAVYRKNLLPQDGHPKPASVGRPALYRRSELEEYFGRPLRVVEIVDGVNHVIVEPSEASA